MCVLYNNLQSLTPEGSTRRTRRSRRSLGSSGPFRDLRKLPFAEAGCFGVSGSNRAPALPWPALSAKESNFFLPRVLIFPGSRARCA